MLILSGSRWTLSVQLLEQGQLVYQKQHSGCNFRRNWLNLSLQLCNLFFRLYCIPSNWQTWHKHWLSKCFLLTSTYFWVRYSFCHAVGNACFFRVKSTRRNSRRVFSDIFWTRRIDPVMSLILYWVRNPVCVFSGWCSSKRNMFSLIFNWVRKLMVP